MKAIDFEVVFFCSAVYSEVDLLTFESAENVKCDHSNKSYCVVLSSGAVYYAEKGGSNF